MEHTITKKLLVAEVAEKTGVSKKQTEEFLTALTTVIKDNLKEGNKVDLSGFGKFEVKARKPRNGINPKTKETIKIPASKSVGFKAAKALKDLVK